MSASSVMIKGMKSGISLVLDGTMDFEGLEPQIAEKFRQSSDFLGNASIALSFEGKALTDDQKRRVLDIISENTRLDVVCVMESDPLKERQMERKLDQRLAEREANIGRFYQGNLRSGQILDQETSVIVLGDVNPGAKVSSQGSIIVLGALKGNAFAGAGGNDSAFVMALEMDPVQIRIAGFCARSSDDRPRARQPMEPKIAYVEDGGIYIEPFSKDVMNDIRYFR